MGKKKVETKVFQVGKGRRRDSYRSPIFGPPNTNLDFYNKKTGSFVGRRKYCESGWAVKDLDKKHTTHGGYDHVHVYDGKVRGSENPLNFQERREIKKASKKRRFYK